MALTAASISNVRHHSAQTHVRRQREGKRGCHEVPGRGIKNDKLRKRRVQALESGVGGGWGRRQHDPEPAVFRQPAGIAFCSLHLLLHTRDTHEPQLAGMARAIWEAVVVVLKHRSARINSHKYSWP